MASLTLPDYIYIRCALETQLDALERLNLNVNETKVVDTYTGTAAALSKTKRIITELKTHKGGV